MPSPLWPLPDNALPFNDVADRIKLREYTEQARTETTPDGIVIVHLPDVKPQDLPRIERAVRRGTLSTGPR